MATISHEVPGSARPSLNIEASSYPQSNRVTRREFISGSTKAIFVGTGMTILGPILFDRAKERIDLSQSYIDGASPAGSPSLDVFREQQRQELDNAKVDKRNAISIAVAGPITLIAGIAFRIRNRHKEKLFKILPEE